ncbi:MAG TPA: hypothetical protein VF167_02455 [Longimicrobiaceae bacterium]
MTMQTPRFSRERKASGVWEVRDGQHLPHGQCGTPLCTKPAVGSALRLTGRRITRQYCASCRSLYTPRTTR